MSIVRANKHGWYLIAWVILCIILGLVVFPACCADYINYDSTYQYFLTQLSMSNLLHLLPLDYSPPLYSVALKLFTDLFGTTLLTMRIFSLLILFSLFLIALFPIRSAFGGKTAAVGALLFLCSSINYSFLTEIRPTTMAYAFVTATAVYAYLAYCRQKRSDFCAFTICSVLSMYTHNIGMLAVFGMYLTLCAFSLFRKDLFRLKKFLICGTLCALAYFPWLLVVLQQFSNVKNHYWKATPADPFSLGVFLLLQPFLDHGKNLIVEKSRTV